MMETRTSRQPLFGKKRKEDIWDRIASEFYFFSIINVNVINIY